MNPRPEPTSTETNEVDDTEFLSASNASAAYRTVPGTERLPATGASDARDGLSAQDDASATDHFRSDGHMKIVAPGHV